MFGKKTNKLLMLISFCRDSTPTLYSKKKKMLFRLFISMFITDVLSS